jgi:hypothetical protein
MLICGTYKMTGYKQGNGKVTHNTSIILLSSLNKIINNKRLVMTSYL